MFKPHSIMPVHKDSPSYPFELTRRGLIAALSGLAATASAAASKLQAPSKPW